MSKDRSRTIGSALLATGLAVYISACSSSSTSNTAEHHPNPLACPNSRLRGSAHAASPAAPATSIKLTNLAGYQFLAAEQYLADTGLRFTKQEETSKLQCGFVVITDPLPGTKVTAGANVNLIVSTGPYGCTNCNQSGILAHVRVPNIAGQTLQQALLTLAEHGLTLAKGPYAHHASSEQKGTIAMSIPAAGTWVEDAGPSSEPIVPVISSGR